MIRSDFQAMLAAVSVGFAPRESNGLTVYIVPAFERAGVRYGFTSRLGGVSKGRFASLNLSLKPEDDPALVRENLARLCAVFGTECSQTVVCNYQHGENVEPVDASHCGMGYCRENTLPGCDGIMTDTPGLPLVTLHADCVPIALYDPVHEAVCVCHAGWRGVVKGIPTNAVCKMTAQYETSPTDIIAAIGPCIGSCCFEVDEDVAEQFTRDHDGLGVIEQRGTKYHIDLAKCIAKQFFDAGIRPGNITIANLCTFCDQERFFSYRRDGAPTGAMAQMIIMENTQ